MIQLRSFIDNYPRLSSFLAGLIVPLIFAPLYLLPALFGVSVFSYQITRPSNDWRAVRVLSFCFGLGYFIVGLYWVSCPILLHFQQLWWVLPFSLLGLPALVATLMVPVGMVAYAFRGSLLYDAYFALIWMIYEWVSSWFLTGLPWNLLGYSLSFSTSMIQSTSIWGVIGLSAVLAFLASSCRRMFDGSENGIKRSSLIVLVGGVCLFAFGHVRILLIGEMPLTEVSVRLVQPNIDHATQANPCSLVDNLKLHLNLSTAGDDFEPRVIIWPESAVPFEIGNKKLLELLSSFLSPNQTLIVGSEGGDYIGAYAIDHLGNITATYNKVHLVPFGEYFPGKNLLPTSWQLAIDKLLEEVMELKYVPGNPDQKMLVGGLSIKPLICYESIFPDEVRVLDLSAQLLLCLANDNWFEGSGAPYQHFELSRMRAVENGIPMIMVANKGVAAIIDPLGKISSRTLDTKNPTYIDDFVPSRLDHGTVYGKTGTKCWILFFALAIFISEILIKVFHKQNGN